MEYAKDVKKDINYENLIENRKERNQGPIDHVKQNIKLTSKIQKIRDI